MEYVIKIHSILKLWRTRNLSLEGKITTFKTLVFSKIIHLALATNVPTSFTDLLKNIQKEFLWSGKMFNNWAKHLSSPVTLPSEIVSQYIWFNKKIQIDKKNKN